ncbi:multiple sugar transport system permease protein [Kibdelosporangium banguiense]|uniref:Multiple sugar transport system permease protein n=1 Tax=Kibdelosporangium banguiense TaxID=1365924 RepID=A0ABS4U1H4_9PSEU|nr:sugar ABC transporter permease [Kibdelosporangium banguiense]MBP2330501.1 multiple sugar transport system permease protein [Kibdelosporangium banguiense]
MSSTALKPPDARTGAFIPVHKRKRHKHNLAGYSFLAPWLIGLFSFTLLPMAYSAYLSMTKFDLLTPPQWTGLANFKMLLQDERYLQSVKVTLIYVVTSVPLKLAAALLVAMALNRGLKALGFYRSVFYLPSLLGASVAVSVMWRQIFSQQGLLNDFLGLFGIQGADWIGDPRYAMWTLVLLSAWQFGTPMLIFLAGLKQLPQDLYEAAALDGAGPVRMFFKITLPLLSPMVFFNLVLETINAFQTFTPAYVVSGGLGGPIDSTLLYTLYLYLKGFGSMQMGYASAMAWVLFAVIGLFTALYFWSARRWVNYAD